MTPITLRAYMQKNSNVSLQDIMQNLSIDLELGKSLVQFWVVRGLCKQVSSCHGCHAKCESKLYYQWIEYA